MPVNIGVAYSRWKELLRRRFHKGCGGCLLSARQDREVWFQVKIPLSRNLTVGCDHQGDAERDPALGSGSGRNRSHGHPCPSRVPFYYFPIDHQQPQRPCG